MADTIYPGRCLCGAVTFEATGRPKWTGYCHCHSCRKQTGAPVAAYAGYQAERVTFGGEPPATFASSPGVVRSFCGRCGSAVAFTGERWPGEVHLHVGAFDDPESFPPKGQGFPEERLSWLHLELP